MENILYSLHFPQAFIIEQPVSQNRNAKIFSLLVLLS